MRCSRWRYPTALLGLMALAAPIEAQRPPDLTGKVSASLGMQGRVLWVDGTANLTRKIKVNGVEQVVDFTTTREGVAEIVRKSKAVGVNTLVVDVKPLSGLVLYNSKVAPRTKEWRGRPVPNFDVLAAFLEEGHKAGLKILANINTLSEGHKYFQAGLAYKYPERQSLVYTINRGIVTPDGARLMVRAPGEPDDAAKPVLLSGGKPILGGDPESGLIGLESSETDSGLVSARPATPFGKRMHLTLDADSRVMGLLDESLLGDDPLVAPEGGHIISAERSSDRAWMAQNLKVGRFVRFDMRTGRTPIAQAPSEKVACFVNPLHPEARRHILEVVREIVTGYDIDGLVLDRCRYSNLYNDFSDLSRDTFARWLDTQASGDSLRYKITRWPEDVFAFAEHPGEPIVQGPLYKLWLEFRAQVIRDLVAEIARTVRALKPQISLGVYVGGWYPQYYEVGVNWGSPNTHLRYGWFTPSYPRTGYAPLVDWITTGCYYPTATREEARRHGQSERATVEYASELSNLAVANDAFVYPGLFVPDYAGRPEAFLRALQAAAKQGQGWMIFDLVYIEEYDWWPLLEKAFANATPPAPHNFPEVLAAIRAAAVAAQ